MQRRYLVVAVAVAIVTGTAVVAPTWQQPSVEAATETTAASATEMSGCYPEGSSDSRYEWCFSDPGEDGEGNVIPDYTIETHLKNIVKNAGDGDTIRISIFNWHRERLVDPLIAAAEDGADVRVIFDEWGAQCDSGSGSGSGSGCSGSSGSGVQNVGDDGNPAYTRLRNHDQVGVTTCEDSCLSTNINHNKLFLFDIDGVQKVAVTSANLVDNQMTLPNNLAQVNGDRELYRYMVGYWNRMEAGSWSIDDGLGNWTSNSDRAYVGGFTKAYLYPRNGEDFAGDNILGILENVTACREDGSSRVWVTPMTFRSPRSHIAERLVDLQDDGCDVRVVVNTASQNSQDMLGWLRAEGLTTSKVRHTDTHNKFMVIDAKYGSQWRKAVFTGSHNFNRPSLRTNDEVNLRILSPQVADSYADYFEMLYNGAEQE